MILTLKPLNWTFFPDKWSRHFQIKIWFLDKILHVWFQDTKIWYLILNCLYLGSLILYRNVFYSRLSYGSCLSNETQWDQSSPGNSASHYSDQSMTKLNILTAWVVLIKSNAQKFSSWNLNFVWQQSTTRLGLQCQTPVKIKPLFLF